MFIKHINRIKYISIFFCFLISWIWIRNEHTSDTVSSSEDDDEDECENEDDDDDDEDNKNENHEIVLVNDEEGEKRCREQNPRKNIKIIRLDKIKKLPHYDR